MNYRPLVPRLRLPPRHADAAPAPMCRLEEMTCTLYDGSRVQALGFTTHPCSRTCPTLGFAHPSERYLQIVRVGIAASGIDKSYQDWLEELQPYRRAEHGL